MQQATGLRLWAHGFSALSSLVCSKYLESRILMCFAYLLVAFRAAMVQSPTASRQASDQCGTSELPNQDSKPSSRGFLMSGNYFCSQICGRFDQVSHLGTQLTSWTGLYSCQACVPSPPSRTRLISRSSSDCSASMKTAKGLH